VTDNAAEKISQQLRANRCIQVARQASALARAFGFVCLDLDPDGSLGPPDALLGAAGAILDVHAKQRPLRWRCKAKHLFVGSVQMLADARHRQCPACETERLCRTTAFMDPGGVCEVAEFVERVGPNRTIDIVSEAEQARLLEYPLFGHQARFKVTFRCAQGHRWQTIERLFSQSSHLKLGRSERVDAKWSRGDSPSYSCHRCIECALSAQQQLLQRAADTFYQRDEVLAPAHSSSASNARTTKEALSAATECERLLKLGPTASARQILGIPLSASHDAAAGKRHFRHLARLLHPDKCNLPNAAEAFKRVLDAFETFEKGLKG